MKSFNIWNAVKLLLSTVICTVICLRVKEKLNDECLVCKFNYHGRSQC